MPKLETRLIQKGIFSFMFFANPERILKTAVPWLQELPLYLGHHSGSLEPSNFPDHFSLLAEWGMERNRLT